MTGTIFFSLVGGALAPNNYSRLKPLLRPMFRFILNAIDNHSHLQLNKPVIGNWLFFMYVCVCNAITDKQIRKAAESGVRDLWALQAELGVATNCGSCKEVASEILAEYRGAPLATRHQDRGGERAGDLPGVPKVYVPAMA